MVERYMVTCSICIVARVFESVVVVAEVYEYPDLLLSMGILALGSYPEYLKEKSELPSCSD
jgi:hypothetical protein